MRDSERIEFHRQLTAFAQLLNLVISSDVFPANEDIGHCPLPSSALEEVLDFRAVLSFVDVYDLCAYPAILQQAPGLPAEWTGRLCEDDD